MSALVEAFQRIEDARLRVVATLESVDYEIEFIRDDVEEQYSEADFEEAYRHIIANQVSADNFRQTVGFSHLDCQVLLFEESIVFLFPSSRYDGLFLSFDYEHPFPLQSVVDTAHTISHIPDEPS